MKLMKTIFGTLLFSLSLHVYPQIGIGTTNPNSSSILDISSTDKGLLIPRLTNNEILDINMPAHGLLVFNTSINNLQVNIGTHNYPYWSSLNSNGLNTVGLVPDISGVSGVFQKDQAINNSKFTITFINNSFNDVGMELSSDNIILNGVDGISVGNISQPYPWVSQGDTISVDFELTGTPLNAGELICNFKYKGMVYIDVINVSN